MIIGVDYSLTSPAVCLHLGDEFTVTNCKFFYLSSVKKSLKFNERFEGTLYPDYSNALQRYNNISEWVLGIVREYGVTRVYIEDYAFAAVGKVFHIAENTGVLKYRLWKEHGIIPEAVPPTVIKKAASGRGNANKEDMQQAFVKETGLNLKEYLQLTDKQWNPSSDIIDSYYICKFGALDYVKKE